MLAFPMIDDFAFQFLSQLFKTNVLVVEDDDVLQPFMKRIIKYVNSQAEVHAVANVTDALKKLSEHEYGLIIADFHLEGKLTGLDLYYYCKDNFQQVPFLMMSGINQEAFKNMVRKGDKPPLFLQKPFMLEEGIRVLSELLESA